MKNLILLAAVLLICFGALEAGVRLLKLEEPARTGEETPKEDWALLQERVWMEHHPSLGWYHQKGKDAVLNLRDYSVSVHTNSRGMRSLREYDTKKTPGLTRILALGDSFTFGFGVGNEESFPAVMESRFPNVEVLNLGVAGYGIDQMLVAFREIGKAYEADYVLISVFPEDFWRNLRRFADTGHAKPYFVLQGDGRLQLKNVPVPPPFTLKTRQFPEVIQYSPPERFLMQSAAYRLLKRALTKIGKELKLIAPDTTTEWILGRAILKQLMQEVREAGMHPVLVIVPPDRWIRDHSLISLRASLLRLAREEDWDLVDLTENFYRAAKQSSVNDYYIEGDGHWTPEGHRLAARVLEQFLHEKGASLGLRA